MKKIKDKLITIYPQLIFLIVTFCIFMPSSLFLGNIDQFAVGFAALLNYGYRMEAEIMYKRTMRLLGEDLEKTGCLHEYYNPFNGEPVMNGGFINWNILALNMADELEGKKPMCLPELLEKQAEKQSL